MLGSSGDWIGRLTVLELHDLEEHFHRVGQVVTLQLGSLHCTVHAKNELLSTSHFGGFHYLEQTPPLGALGDRFPDGVH